MSRLDYELLADEMPWLDLPKWRDLHQKDIERLKKHTQQTLVASLAALKLAGCYLNEEGSFEQ